jgi:hypothetical protein
MGAGQSRYSTARSYSSLAYPFTYGSDVAVAKLSLRRRAYLIERQFRTIAMGLGSRLIGLQQRVRGELAEGVAFFLSRTTNDELPTYVPTNPAGPNFNSQPGVLPRQTTGALPFPVSTTLIILLQRLAGFGVIAIVIARAAMLVPIPPINRQFERQRRRSGYW